jgi:hypothetical protein
MAALAPSAALADPPAVDDRTPSCGVLLGSVEDWPGTGPTGVRLYSDAYERYLLSLPACVDPEG